MTYSFLSVQLESNDVKQNYKSMKDDFVVKNIIQLESVVTDEAKVEILGLPMRFGVSVPDAQLPSNVPFVVVGGYKRANIGAIGCDQLSTYDVKLLTYK